MGDVGKLLTCRCPGKVKKLTTSRIAPRSPASWNTMIAFHAAWTNIEGYRLRLRLRKVPKTSPRTKWLTRLPDAWHPETSGFDGCASFG